MLHQDIGDTSVDQPDYVTVEINPGDTITVTNVATSNAVLNYLTSFDAGPAGTLTAGQSQTFTVGPLYLESPGVASVTISGGVYGN